MNSDLIKFIENAPDTVITLVNGEKLVVLDTTEDVLERIVEFRQRVMAGLILANAFSPRGAGVSVLSEPSEDAT